MAQTGFTPIQLYYSSTTTNVPLAANLASGELAINITDGKLFYKDNANAVQVIGWKIVPATAGGTGQTSYAVGDLLYADTTTTLAKLPDVATGNALISGGVGVAPSWGKIGLTTHVSGVLPVANGGTNLSSYTANSVVYASSTSALATGSVLKFDGSNFGLGVTPSAWSVPAGNAMEIGTVGNSIWGVGASNMIVGSNIYYASSNYKYANTGSAASAYQQSAGGHYWYNAASGTAGNTITFTQAMTLESSGTLLLGTTSSWGGSPKMEIRQTTAAWGLSSYHSSTGGGAVLLRVDNTAVNLAGFYYTGSVNVGNITTNGTSTTYGTASDYRLKEDIQPMTGALAKIAALNPVTYKWKSSGKQDDGFIAHELQAVCPSAVTGAKDAVDEEGNPKYQGIDVSFLVATLTAAIKEQQALITQLQADVAALK
jgi:hypothetical protein